VVFLCFFFLALGAAPFLIYRFCGERIRRAFGGGTSSFTAVEDAPTQTTTSVQAAPGQAPTSYSTF